MVRRRRERQWLTGLVITTLGLGVGLGSCRFDRVLHPEILPTYELIELGRWLSKKEDIAGPIVNTDFGEVPFLIFHNRKNLYPTMLDGAFLYNYDPQVYKSWVGIVTLQDADYPTTLRDVFGTDYLLVSRTTAPRLAGFLDFDPRMRPLYLADNCGLFRRSDEECGYVRAWEVSVPYGMEEPVILADIAWTERILFGEFIQLRAEYPSAALYEKRYFRGSMIGGKGSRNQILSASIAESGVVWVNRNQYIVDTAPGGLRGDESEAKVRLREGWNEVIVAVLRQSPDWGFAVRFHDGTHRKRAQGAKQRALRESRSLRGN